MVNRLNYWFKLFSNALKVSKINTLGKNDVLIVCSDLDRSFISEGLFYSPILDSVNEVLCKNNLKTVSVNYPLSNLNTSKIFGNGISVNGTISRAIILNKIFRNGDFVVNAWKKILKDIDPKIIMGILPLPELCIAANKLNIQVIDLQHGVISDEGYYGQSYRKMYDNIGWPNWILCWDKKSYDWVKKNINQVKTKIIGNIWVSRFLFFDAKDEMINNIVSNNKIENYLNRKNILVTLQWDRDNMNRKKNYGLSDELIDTIFNDSTRNWMIRFHPIQIKTIGKDKLFNHMTILFKKCKNVFWKDVSNFPLPLILKLSDLHITSFSAVTIEASFFGIKTGLLYEKIDLLHEYFSNEINNGYAEIIMNNYESISKWIHLNLKKLEKKNNLHKFDQQLLIKIINE
jgi:hypothetical protein